MFPMTYKQLDEVACAIGSYHYYKCLCQRYSSFRGAPNAGYSIASALSPHSAYEGDSVYPDTDPINISVTRSSDNRNAWFRSGNGSRCGVQYKRGCVFGSRKPQVGIAEQEEKTSALGLKRQRIKDIDLGDRTLERTSGYILVLAEQHGVCRWRTARAAVPAILRGEANTGSIGAIETV